MNPNELDEMRQQMALLKDKLNHQEIVNDQLVRNAVKGRIGDLTSMRHRKRFMLILCTLLVPAMLIGAIGLPAWFACATAAFFILALVYSEYYMDGIDDRDLTSRGLLQVSEKAARLKRQTKRWLWVGLPLLAVWIVTFCYLVNNNTWFEIQNNEIVTGVITGLVIGGLLGFLMYNRQQRMVDDLQAAIDEMREE